MSHQPGSSLEGTPLLSSLRSAYDGRDVQANLDETLRLHVVQLRDEVARLEVPRPVSSALEYICGHLYDPSLNVNAVLEEIDDPAPSFRSAFRWHVGLPPKRFIEASRMSAAQRAMNDTGASCHVVSYRVGYIYYRTFSRAFRRFFGHAPGDPSS